MNQLLGPLLILAGILLLDLIKVSLPGGKLSEKILTRIKPDSVWGAGLLGALFALSFCPVSAALFFGGLIPLSIKEGSNLLYPALYGIGTALPVALFALLVAFGAGSVGKAFKSIRQFESVARQLTGILFVAVGIYYCLRYIFGIF